ncbi:holo-ACP synthase [Natronincola ferrireducens]|uniref:Holo-[acyl-carrier-protein] synthase n=1 Tax=Natronincola ferrireducens TaxID=393762 RepID=A0A1G9G5V7_9FIRM|nr:holo-ACP synthase [Natronincola ferrireducens]SDK95966.1 holo-[acyl-carrier-protein] synthase [Natronincola ferrireducens]
MIKGLGIDIIEIYRIERAIHKNPRFLERIFTEEEVLLFEERNQQPSTIAGFFAAKEAAVKALGTGIRDIQWRDIEIKKTPEGKPYIKLHNNAATIAYSKDIKEILVSISHSKDYAVAQAIAF